MISLFFSSTYECTCATCKPIFYRSQNQAQGHHREEDEVYRMGQLCFAVMSCCYKISATDGGKGYFYLFYDGDSLFVLLRGWKEKRYDRYRCVLLWKNTPLKIVNNLTLLGDTFRFVLLLLLYSTNNLLRYKKNIRPHECLLLGFYSKLYRFNKLHQIKVDKNVPFDHVA